MHTRLALRFTLAEEMGGYAAVEAAAKCHITLKPQVPTAPGALGRGGMLMRVAERKA